MELAVWGISVLTMLFMLMSGGTKLAFPRRRLITRMRWAETWSDANFKLLGAIEVLGALGLVLPSATGILPVLTPMAAVGLATIMAVAAKTKIDLGESPAPAVIVGMACCAIAVARW